MKRLISIILCAIIFLSGLFTLSACNKREGDFEYTIEDGYAVLRHYHTQGDSVVELPETLGGYPLKEIADFGLCNTESVEKIIIGKNVEKINSWSFTNNQGLVAYEVHPDNTHFKAVDGVLYNYELTHLYYYPNNKLEMVEVTDDNGSTRTVKQINYTILEGVKVIGNKAFYKCWFTNNIVFPSTLEVIEEKAFAYNDNATTFVFNEGLLRIEADAFLLCYRLNTIEIPSSVEYIGDYAFYNCNQMKTFIVHKSESETANWGFKWWPTSNGDNLRNFNIEYA